MSRLVIEQGGDNLMLLPKTEMRRNGQAKYVFFTQGYGDQLQGTYFSAIAIKVSVISIFCSMFEYALSN
jgi:hypothetical protein